MDGAARHSTCRRIRHVEKCAPMARLNYAKEQWYCAGNWVGEQEVAGIISFCFSKSQIFNLSWRLAWWGPTTEEQGTKLKVHNTKYEEQSCLLKYS
jgi:hypothetical protein